MIRRSTVILSTVFIIVLIIIFVVSTNLPVQIKQSFSLVDGVSFDVTDTLYGEFDGMEKELSQKEVFLFGEIHATKTNYDLKLRYITYLAKYHDLRYILIESGFSTGEILNLYLQNNDEEILTDILSSYNGSFIQSEDTRKFVEDISVLNETLPTGKKLQFVGIDAEQNPVSVGVYMKSFFPKETKPSKNIKSYVEAINSNNVINMNEEFMQSLNSALFTYKDDFEEYLGTGYEEFLHCITNAIDLIVDGYNINRDEVLTQNFIHAYKTLPKGKYFGQLGILHVINSDEPNNFANMLRNEIPALQDKVFTCAYRYADSFFLHPRNGNMEIIDFSAPKIFKTKNDTIFYNKEQTKNIQFVMEEKHKPERYADYMVLIKKSPSATQLGN